LTPNLNQIVDRFLLGPSKYNLAAVRRSSSAGEGVVVAERVRRRAAVVCKAHPERSSQILRARNTLIFAIYGDAAPPGWSCAWSDGSSFRFNHHRIAGLGGVLVGPDGHRLARISRIVADLDPFEAEIAALAATLQTALAHDVERIRAHIDCDALVSLWSEQRSDPRLAPLRALATRFRRIHLRAVPRQHNQPADRLARAAVQRWSRRASAASSRR
jgi:ribonuclease HI